MRFECWVCGRRETFKDMCEFILEGWSRLEVGTHRNPLRRDYCSDCADKVDMVEQTEEMMVA